jgi:hypothetical protein
MVKDEAGPMGQVMRSLYRCPTVSCCLIIAILFVSFSHVTPTNVNSSSPTVNVSPAAQGHADLKAKVEALENQPLGLSNLGISGPFESPNVTEIIAEGDNAVPFLVEALQQKNKPVLLGYAAYCLRRIKLTKGRSLRSNCIRNSIITKRV